MENDIKSKKQATIMRATNLAFEFGFIIALPIIAFGLLGKYLDKKFDTHYIVLIGVLLAVASSTTWLYKRIKAILEDLRKNKE